MSKLVSSFWGHILQNFDMEMLKTVDNIKLSLLVEEV